MKTTLFILSLLLVQPLFGQELPRISPTATITQRIGLTDVSITYGRPSLRGRKGRIWGKLIPYGELWRAGANEATLLEVSEDVRLNGNEVPAGKYALFVTPRKRDPWTITLTTDTTSWGTEGFNALNIVTQFQAEGQKKCRKPLETLRFSFDKVSETSATIELFWEKRGCQFQILTNTREQALANIEEALKDKPQDWRVYARSAEFYVKHLTETDKKARQKALGWVDKGLKIHDQHYLLHWLKAQLLAQEKDFSGAVEYARRALTLGIEQEGRGFAYRSQLEQLIALWEQEN